MLSSMRNNRKILSIVLWLVILAFVSTIFVVWGIGSRENQASYVAKVGDTVIGYDEYRNFYDEVTNQFRQVYGEAYDDFAKSVNIDKLVLDDMINRKLLLTSAIKLGIPATDREIAEAIKVIPAFQTEGRFDPAQYVQVLNYYRQTPAIFENSIRETLLIRKLQDLITGAQSAVTEEAAMLEYDYRGKEAVASYFAVPVKNFLPALQPSKEVLTAFYEANKENYRVSPKIKLKYILFDKTKFGDNIIISDEEIEGYYKDNAAKYSVPESVTIRNIIVPVSDWNDKAQAETARKKIDAALEELKKGVDFKAAAAKYSDPKLTHDDGLIGSVVKGQLLPELDYVAFSLEPGKYSDIVKSNAGYHIVFIDEKRPAKTFSLEEKKDEIAQELKKNKLNGAFRNYVLNVYKDVLKASNITAYTKEYPENDLSVSETGFFSESDMGLPVFLSLPEVKKSLFALNKSELSQIVEDGDATYLFEAEDKINSHVPSFEKIEARVTEDYEKAEAEKAAVKTIEETLEKDGFDKAAKTFKVPIEKTGEFKRTVPAPVFASSAEIVDLIFETKSGETLKKVYIFGDKAYAVKTDKIISPPKDGFEAEKEAITTYIAGVKGEEALASYLISLRSKTKIDINPAFINTKTN